MAIILKYPNRPRVRTATKTASTAYGADSAICLDEDATGAAFTQAATTTIRIAGILQNAVASTDSDYATTTVRKPYLVDEDGEWQCLVSTGTADANDEGGYIDFHSTTGVALDVTASTTDAFLVTRFVSGTQVIGTFTGWQGRYGPAAD